MADDPISAALGKIEATEQAATPGPWKLERERGYDMDDQPWSLLSVTGPDGREILGACVDQPPADLRFAAAARTSVPRLLAACRLMLTLYGRYVTPEEYAAILAALTGRDTTDNA